jgi:hypothetical protein
MVLLQLREISIDHNALLVVEEDRFQIELSKDPPELLYLHEPMMLRSIQESGILQVIEMAIEI